MVPGGDVVTPAIAVVLEPDDGQEVLRHQRGVDRHDAVVEGHHAALTSAPDIFVYIEDDPNVEITAVVAVIYA